MSGQIQTSDANATISRTVVISSGTTTSPQIDLTPIKNSTNTLNGNVPILLLQMPAAFTGTSISFQVSCDGGTTFQTLYDDNGAVISVLVAASRTIACPSLGPADQVKLVSSASEGADRSIVVKAGAGGPTIQRPAGTSSGTVTVFGGANTSVLATAVTVNNVATQLPASPLANRKNITIFNNDASVTMYVGGSGVTSSAGVGILPQSAMSFDLGPSALIYGITAAATINVRVVEVS